ncbi:MAG: FAD:protein FMN transferase [Acholeplasmataceae bacterium]|nr:FAD:protein FMN transferase [Acholeplasmataceae bacterium]
MKKFLYLPILIMLIMLLSSCKKEGSMYSAVYFQMDSEIRITYMANSQEQANEYKARMGEIYAMYHSLSDNYSPLGENSPYLENIYTINMKINQDVEIDYELYQILEESIYYKELTDGFFDISIGKIVKLWKDVILDPVVRGDEYQIPQSLFESVQESIAAIEVHENPYTLTEVSGKYYVRINHSDVQLDLGAIAKGYATEIVKNYLIENDVVYFAINAGSSTISVGKNNNPERKNKQWNVELIDPLVNNSYFGLIELRDQSIATSGNNVQYATYNNLRYHHIVSPQTKYSMHYYHSLTMIGNDAGLLDAISTAFFSMSPTAISSWLDAHQEELGIEVILYNYDGTITTHLLETVFKGY